MKGKKLLVALNPHLKMAQALNEQVLRITRTEYSQMVMLRLPHGRSQGAQRAWKSYACRHEFIIQWPKPSIKSPSRDYVFLRAHLLSHRSGRRRLYKRALTQQGSS